MNEPKSVAQGNPASSPVSSSLDQGGGTPAQAVQHKPFTAKQQAIWDLTRPLGEGGQGKTRAEAAAMLGISAPVVSKTLQACYRKKGIRHAKGQFSVSSALEVKDPAKAAAILDAITEPAALKKLKEAYAECGLPESVSSALVRRLKAKYYGAVTATKNLKASEIAQLFSEKIDLAARYMDDKTAGEASFRDLALAATAMAEKRQLMRGEPTQIISDHERKQLHELLPLAIAEVQRRGLTIQGVVTEKTVEPG